MSARAGGGRTSPSLVPIIVQITLFVTGIFMTALGSYLAILRDDDRASVEAVSALRERVRAVEVRIERIEAAEQRARN